MSDINIHKVLSGKRREKGVTQEELAAHIGVSKASVSKWENGQSCPDIALLPRLAAYFNITIDQLMGYSSQMSQQEIDRVFRRLAAAFCEEGASQVLAECRELVRQYYSCYPFLLHMALFYLNHCAMVEADGGRKALLGETSELCARIVKECGDIVIRKQAVGLEAACRLLMDDPAGVLELLGESSAVLSQDEGLISLAYQKMGNIEKARDIIQVSIYQHMAAMTDHMISYIYLNADRPEVEEETWNRLMAVADVFCLDRLRPPAMLQAYIIAAASAAERGEKERAINLLGRYADLCGTAPDLTRLRGDAYFNAVEEWMDEKQINSVSMKDQRVLQNEMIQGTLTLPAFEALAEDPDFCSIVRRLTGDSTLRGRDAARSAKGV